MSAAPTDVLAMVVVLVTVVPLFAGMLLFHFRLRIRSLYGVTEVVVGVLVAIFKVFGNSPGAFATNADFILAMLTASVYLIVRGLDNVHQGYRDPSKDSLAATVRKWIDKRSGNPTPLHP